MSASEVWGIVIVAVLLAGLLVLAVYAEWKDKQRANRIESTAPTITLLPNGEFKVEAPGQEAHFRTLQNAVDWVERNA